jgi:hypothetical protein
MLEARFSFRQNMSSSTGAKVPCAPQGPGPLPKMFATFAIAIGAVVAGILLAFYLRSRVTEEGDDWEAPAGSGLSSNHSAVAGSSQGHAKAMDSLHDSQQARVQSMNSSSGQNSQTPRDIELRRSSRVEKNVPLLVLGINRSGESFQETTSAVSVNLHGCRYASRHEYPLGGWVTLQLTGTEGRAARSVRARVRSVLTPRTPRELCQVGVELETPGNIWGISAPPEDWQRTLQAYSAGATADEWRRVFTATNTSDTAVVTPIAPPLDSSASLSSALERHLAQPEKKAEVTMFPGPAASPEQQASAANAATPMKSQRIVLTTEQLLQALQGKLQQAADRAMKTAVSTQLDEAVRAALSRIDDVWKANVRQTEEFSTARLTEAQNRWERELVVYRGRAEEISRRLEALCARTNQTLSESHKLLEHLTTEIEPQLHSRLDQSFTQAASQFEARAKELSERTLTKWSEGANLAALDARAKLDEGLAEARALRNGNPPGVSEQQVKALVNSSREQTLNRQDERLAEIWRQFEQQQDQAKQRTDEIAQKIDALAKELQEARTQQERAVGEMRSLSSTSAPGGGLSQQQFDSAMESAKQQFHDLLEWRLGEVSAHFQQLHDAAEQHSGETKQHLETLAAETRGAHAQHEQNLTDLRAQLASVPASVSQERLDWLLNSAREQILNHIEWRVGEASAEFEEQHEAARHRSEEIAQTFQKFAAETRARLEESKALAERASREVPARADVTADEHSVERASHDFETAAARISDRQLIHLMEQKQALTNEAALELEAHATETRALLQKAANATLEEFRRRVEVQMDLITAEATERVTSALASIDAENRAACDTRRRSLESDVARAAEQSTMEFRSGIRAFLYSCLVAAVGAVDQHAQTTLAGLSKDPNAPPLTLSTPEAPAAQPEERSSAASASSSPTSGNNL